MDIQEIKSIYQTHPHVKATIAFLESDGACNLFLPGLNGSGEAVVTAFIFEKKRGLFLCIQNDPEEAGYFYNDLMQLMNGKNVYFFPSAYHRHIKYGHMDSANVILRTETLGLLQDENPSCIIVTYPEDIAERVLSKKVLKDHTLTIHTGEKIDPMFVSDVLEQSGFEQSGYVYEPGQYAIRGSIVDIFSFSNEDPFRLDFFGNEVETIRVFDVETQLSKNKIEEIRIIPEIGKHNGTDASLFDLLPKSALLTCRDMRWCTERIGGLWNVTPVNSDEEGFADSNALRKKLIAPEIFLKSTARFRKIHFHPEKKRTDATIRFDTSPQPFYH